MIVVSDTSPMTALLQIGQGDLARRLFARVIIPEEVRDELLREHAALPSWLETLRPSGLPPSIDAAGLDSGETQAIALAIELRADALLIDERRGRKVAREYGVRPLGVLGLLVLAKRRRLIPSVRPFISLLQSHAGCWFSDELIEEICASVGE